MSNIIIINTTLGHEAALQEIERHIEDRLRPRFPVQWLNVTKGPTRIHPRNIRVKQV